MQSDSQTETDRQTDSQSVSQSVSQTDRPIDGASLQSLFDVHVLTLVVHHHDLKVVVLCLSIELHQQATCRGG